MRVHLLGIGGAGMGPLAEILLAQGREVSGCDVKESETLRALGEKGVRISTQGNHPDHVADQDLLVYTSRLTPSGRQELEAADAAGIRTIIRPELLAELISRSHSVGVAGTHGKTTVTAMIAHILSQLGWDPTALIGDGGSSRVGSGKVLIAELDESDASLPVHHPQIAVVTNVEFDHQDYFADLAAVRGCFDAFLEGLPKAGLAILCADDPWLKDQAQPLPVRCLTYGFSPEADYRCHLDGQVERLGRPLVRLELCVPGWHNLQNAVAAVAATVDLGVEPSLAAEALSTFSGARRRLEKVGTWREAAIYDDYGHHPTEVRVTVEAARELPHRRLLLVFQPHRYSRYLALREEFISVLGGADQTLITEIYSAGEQNPDGVSSAGLAQAVGCSFVPDLAEARAWLETEVGKGDLVLLMGAGNIRTLGDELAH
jgi:UDP-N-acetylmuramate--alanine ligase